MSVGNNTWHMIRHVKVSVRMIQVSEYDKIRVLQNTCSTNSDFPALFPLLLIYILRK